MKAAAAMLVFVASSVCAALVAGFAFGGLSTPLAWGTLGVGAVAGFATWRLVPSGQRRTPNAWDILMLVIFGLVSLRAFLWLIYAVGDEWRILSPNNLGDISLHLDLIRYLAGGVGFWPDSPILAGTSLVYPVGMDLFNALLALVGVPVERGLVWVGLGGASLAAWALWRWGRAFALAAILFNGGFVGFLVFQTGQITDFQNAVAWKNFFLSMVVTQRGLLFALPAGLFLLDAWRQEFFRSEFGVPAWVCFLLYVAMPLFNVHAFLFLSLVLACAFVVVPARRKFLLAFVGAAFLPATVAVYFVSGRFAASSGLHWAPGWMADGWAFWFLNFGISLPLLLLLAVRIIRKPDPETVCFAGTGLAVFLLCFLVSFAKWEWDNTKLFLWAWITCTPFLWQMIARWHPAIRALVCFLLFFSGAVSLLGGLDARHGYKLASRSELATTAKFLADVPLGDTIAIEPNYNHPVILLGRPVLCGYEGHLSSHGLDYRASYDALQSVLQRKPGWQKILPTLNARWLYLQGPPPTLQPIPHPHELPH